MHWHSRKIAFLLFLLLGLPSLWAGEIPDRHWEILAVAYPPDQTVTVTLGGSEKTLTARGICEVKWHSNAAAVSIEIEKMPSPQEIGMADQQYVLWAISSENKVLNLGVVPPANKNVKWKLQVPFRTFGLLVTAEKNPKAEAPSAAVVLESLLPTDTSLVVPVLRVAVTLAEPKG